MSVLENLKLDSLNKYWNKFLDTVLYTCKKKGSDRGFIKHRIPENNLEDIDSQLSYKECDSD